MLYDLHSHSSVDLGEGFSIAIGSTQVEEVGPHTSVFHRDFFPWGGGGGEGENPSASIREHFGTASNFYHADN